ncbi:chemotaxis protein [Shewanella submarina]|uniref:Chemotaxis protein n=1 Tax=Shewanella submarina TaxID=2016376 RepID=A0ABV7GCU6_9GAMM|nr:chemotaxis protein [Shewanella submarina]MCL1039915.1 chemotaxis protein [Shewanella submarina]
MTSKANQSQGLLLFRLTRHQIFALGTLKIQELVPYCRLNQLPQAHPSVIGTATIRGKTIPVVDMPMAVGYRGITEEEKQDAFIIVTDCHRQITGFLVRKIERIVECNWREIEQPDDNLGKNAFLTGITRVDNELVQLLDVELLMSRIFPFTKQYAAVTDVQREMLKPLNILLVDDSKVARKQLSDALDDLNIPYQVTDNGASALELMQQDARAGRPVDILVSDIEMPGLDGYELAFEVKNDPALSQAYLILHTSLSSEISVSQAHQVGADEALTKFDADELIHAMLTGAHRHSESETA